MDCDRELADRRVCDFRVVLDSVITVRLPQPGDIESIGANAAEEWVRDQFRTGADFSQLIAAPHTHVAVIDTLPVAAGGFIDKGHGDAIAWSLVGIVPTNMFVTLCRVFRRHIAATPFKWIEAHCMASFYQSHRWVKCLGFEPVHGERCFTPDGKEFRKFVFRNDRHGA